MAAWLIPAAIGLATAGSGYLSAQSKRNQSKSAAGQLNRNNQANYARDLLRYNAEREYKLKAFEARRKSVYEGIGLLGQQLQYAYEGEDRRLADIYDQAMVANQKASIALAKVSGATAARGITGNTARRLEAQNLAASGRDTALRIANQSNAAGASGYRRRGFYNRYQANRQQLLASIAVEPYFGPPPSAPTTVQPSYSDGSFFMDLGAAALSGISAGFGAAGGGAQPQPTPFRNSLRFQPIEQATFGVDPTLSVGGPNNFSIAQGLAGRLAGLGY